MREMRYNPERRRLSGIVVSQASVSVAVIDRPPCLVIESDARLIGGTCFELAIRNKKYIWAFLMIK